MSENSRPMKEIFSEIGLKLRAAREAKGMTLRDISEWTRISQTFLDKIEQGDVEGLPGLPFVRGFIRNFMQVLELKDEEIEKALKGLSHTAEYQAETSVRPSIRGLLSEEEPVSIPKMVIIGLVVVLLGWGGYMGFRVFRGDAEKRVTSETATEQTAQAQAASGVARNSETTGTPPGGLPPETNPADQKARALARRMVLEGRQNLKVTVKGLEPTWIRLSIDRAPPFEVQVGTAETLDWEATEEVMLTIGRANGIALYLNGENYPLPTEPDRLVQGIVLNRLTLLRLENMPRQGF